MSLDRRALGHPQAAAPGGQLMLSLANEINLSANLMLRVQQELLAQAVDITSLARIADGLLARVRQDGPESEVARRLTGLMTSIEKLDGLTRQQTCLLDSVAERLCRIAIEVQRLGCAIGDPPPSESNVVPLHAGPQGVAGCPLSAGQVESLHRQLRSIRQKTEIQLAVVRETHGRMHALRLQLEGASAQ
jgi:hypothetical protein